MKLTSLAIVALAVLTMAAAPQEESRGGHRSAWSGLVEGAKSFVHNPFGLVHREQPQAAAGRGAGMPDPRKAQPRGTPRSAAVRDGRVRPATATAVANEPARSKRATLFSRHKRPSRTISEYMAQEKP